MGPQSRLQRYERRTEWPLAAVALLFLGLYSIRAPGQPRDTDVERGDVIG